MPLSNLNESLADLSLEILTTSPRSSSKIEDFAFEWFPSLRHLD